MSLSRLFTGLRSPPESTDHEQSDDDRVILHECRHCGTKLPEKPMRCGMKRGTEKLRCPTCGGTEIATYSFDR